MYLKSVKLTNIKGRTTTVELSPVHVISGPSRTGKTAVLLAVRWLVTGSMPPPYGKTPRLQWLAAGEGTMEMRVDGVMDNGVKAWRKLVKTDSIKVTAYLPDEITVPEMLADPAVFFSLTKQERINMLFTAAGGLRFSDAIIAKAKELGLDTERLEEEAKAQADLAGWEETNAVQSISKYRELMDTPVAPVTQDELDKVRKTFVDAENALKAFQAPVNAYKPASNEVDEAVHWLETVSEADECPCCGCGAAQGWREHAIAVAQTRVKEAKDRAKASAEKENEFHAEVKSSHEKWCGLIAAHSAANTDYNVLLSRREARSRYEAAGGAMRKAEADLLAIRKRMDAIETLRKEIVADKLETLRQSSEAMVDTMNRFATGMIGTPLEFDAEMELGRRVGPADIEAGCTAPIGSWISHRSFSASEQAVAYTALCVALAAKAPFRLVLLDELGRMDATLKEAVLKRCQTLVEEGTIHQFIGAQAA